MDRVYPERFVVIGYRLLLLPELEERFPAEVPELLICPHLLRELEKDVVGFAVTFQLEEGLPLCLKRLHVVWVEGKGLV